jgi:hypothetical protein
MESTVIVAIITGSVTLIGSIITAILKYQENKNLKKENKV